MTDTRYRCVGMGPTGGQIEAFGDTPVAAEQAFAEAAREEARVAALLNDTLADDRLIAVIVPDAPARRAGLPVPTMTPGVFPAPVE